MRVGRYGRKWCGWNRLEQEPGGRRFFGHNLAWVFLFLLILTGHDCIAVPAFDVSNPVSFFTNVAGRLVESELHLNLNRLEIYPTNDYTPGVERLLQVTANVYDATTTNAFPTVFRPLFSSDASGTNIFITGYQRVASVTGIADSQLAAPVDAAALARAQTVFTNESINVYGIPWVIGARKGFPAFYQFYTRSTVQVTRKLQVTRPSSSYIGATETNQMFTISITNRLGYAFWNSYNATNIASGSGLTVYARDIISITLSNGANGDLISSFYGNPNLVQFTFATNMTYWPGSGWTLNNPNPLLQTPQPSSFISGYWDFAFLPESSYLPASRTFAPLGTVGWEVGNTVAEPFPQIQLLTTNRLQAFILDGTNVIDYVQLEGPDSARNIVEELSDSTNNPADVSRINNNLAMWDTNRFFDNDTLQWGPVNQIVVSRYIPTGTILSFWQRPPNMPAALNTPAAEAEYFNSLFTGNSFVYLGKIYLNTNTVIQAPYTPTRTIWEYTAWQANDPLVHYLASDLNTVTAMTGLHRADVVANSPFPSPNLTTVGDHYQPWGRNRQMSQITGTDTSAYNNRLRDPLVWKSDDWNFPTGQTTDRLNWLGRVHRGTPWQTIYLKSGDILQEVQSSSSSVVNIGTNTWTQWAGVSSAKDVQSTSPVSDWRVASLLMAMLQTNDLSQQFSVNNPDSKAWAALFDGFTVSTNTTPLPVPYLTPTFDDLIISSNSHQALAIAMAIATNRSGKPFRNLGDVLTVPELSVQSPYLNWNNVAQQNYGTTDEADEAIASQLLPLLRSDAFGSIVSTSDGQAHLQFSGYDGHVYVTQVSTNLRDWQNIATNSPVNGSIHLVFPNAASNPAAFYRTRLLQ